MSSAPQKEPQTTATEPTKPSETAPRFQEKIEPTRHVKPTPRKATPPVIKKGIPVEPAETIPIKPRETLVGVLIKKCPVLPPAIDRPPEIVINAWLQRINSIRLNIRPDRPKFDLQRLIQNIGRAPSSGPTVKEFVNGAVAEATFTLRCLASEGYVRITETTAQGRWLAIDFPNLEVEFVPERLDEFVEGL